MVDDRELFWEGIFLDYDKVPYQQPTSIDREEENPNICSYHCYYRVMRLLRLLCEHSMGTDIPTKRKGWLIEAQTAITSCEVQSIE
jgi:hypothetical protein